MADKSLGRTDPEIALAILKKAPDLVALDCRRILLVEDVELYPIESSKAAVGREPNVSFSRLNNLMDGVLG